MNLFGSSNRSRSTTTNHNSSGNSAIDGDNYGSSIGNNTGEIQVNLTDHKAVAGAMSLASNSTKHALESNQLNTNQSINGMLAAHKHSSNVLGDMVKQASITASKSLDVV